MPRPSPLRRGQRVAVYEMGAGFVGTGTVIGEGPSYRVALDAKFGGGTVRALRIELEPMFTTPEEFAA